MKNVKEIKNLVFDFGGVIYQIDHEKQKKAFLSLGIDNFEHHYSQAIQTAVFADFEKGLVSENEFRRQVSGFLGLKLPHEIIDENWNSILVGFMDKSVSLLLKLKERYRLFLLSNTNSIHYKLYINEFIEKYGYDFNTLFEKTYWSFQIERRKPDAEVFEFVMAEGNMKSGETIFIDDSVQNTIAATHAGMPSIWLKPGNTLSDLFDEELNLILA